jgi:hypothetical protein
MRWLRADSPRTDYTYRVPVVVNVPGGHISPSIRGGVHHPNRRQRAPVQPTCNTVVAADSHQENSSWCCTFVARAAFRSFRRAGGAAPASRKRPNRAGVPEVRGSDRIAADHYTFAVGITPPWQRHSRPTETRANTKEGQWAHLRGTQALLSTRTAVVQLPLGPHRGHRRTVLTQRSQRSCGPRTARGRTGNDWRPRNTGPPLVGDTGIERVTPTVSMLRRKVLARSIGRRAPLQRGTFRPFYERLLTSGTGTRCRVEPATYDVIAVRRLTRQHEQFDILRRPATAPGDDESEHHPEGRIQRREEHLMIMPDPPREPGRGY